MKSLLRRLHKYPIDLKRAADSTSKSKSVAKYFDGAHSYDDICAKTGEQSSFFRSALLARRINGTRMD